jgi:hypothetical protein
MIRNCIFALVIVLLLGSSAVPAEPFRYPEARHGKGELKYVNGVPVLILAGTPEEIGEQMGVLALKHAPDFATVIKEKVREHAGDVGLVVATQMANGVFKKFPEDYRREIEAMAKAGGVQRDLLVMANTIFDLKGIRLQQRFGCAGLVVEPARSATGGPLLGRNADTPPAGRLCEVGLVVVYRPEGKLPFVTVSYPGLLTCVCGMNAAGLALGCDEATGSADRAPLFNPDGMPALAVQRRVLEVCKTVEEAEKWLRSNPATIHGISPVCDLRTGVVFEVTPKTVAVRKARDHLVCCTNHFLAEGLKLGDDCSRLRELEKAWQIKTLSVADVAARMHAANQKADTIQTMVFEPKELVLHVAFGDGKKSATEFPLRKLDLSKELKR